MIRYLSLLVLGLVLLVCCQATPPLVTRSQPASPIPLATTRTATSISSSLEPVVTPSPLPDTGWQLLRPGLERRVINLLDEAERPFESIYLLRLEPNQFELRIGYHPGRPQTLAAWQVETGALIVLNGGFFTEDYVATGLMIVAGDPSGESYTGFGGMLSVTNAGVNIQQLADRPYTAAEEYQFALQSFPILVKAGGQLGFPEEDGIPARRTVIGLDDNGRLVLLLSRQGSFTLHQLSQWLIDSDLSLDIALNLDGGPSSGLILAEPREELLAFSPLPAVITIHPR